MKARKTVLTTILVLMLALPLLFLQACSSGDEMPGRIDGAKDLHIKVGDTDFDFTAGITVRGDDGSTAKPKADTSEIDFTKSGKYTVKYTGGGNTVIKNVFVYSPPTFYFGGEPLEDEITITLSQANMSSNFEGIVVAKDSFDKSLQITITGDEYTGEYGDYELTLEAQDAAGNNTVKQLTLTITDADSPKITNLTYDVTDADLLIEFDYGEAILPVLYFDGLLVSVSDYSIEAEGVLISGEYLSRLGIGDYPFRLESEVWYTEFRVTIEDKHAPEFTAAGMQGYYFEENTEIEMALALSGIKATHTLTYTLTDQGGGTGYKAVQNGAKLTLSKSNDDFLPASQYTLTIIAANTAGITAENSVTVNVYTENDYLKKLASGDTTQYFSRLANDAKHSTLSFEQLDSDIYGVDAAYKFSILGTGSTWDSRLTFAPGVLDGDGYRWHTNNYSELRLDVYFTGFGGEQSAKLGRAAVSGDYYLNFGIIEKQTQKAIASDAIQTGIWYTLVVDLLYQNPNNNIYLYFSENSGNSAPKEMYLRNFEFVDKDIFYSGDAPQHNAAAFRKFAAENASLQHVQLDQAVYGVSSALKYSTGESYYTTWPGRFECSTQKDGKYDIQNYSAISFDMYIESSVRQGSDDYVNPKIGAEGQATMGTVIDKQTGQTVARDDMVAGKWYTVTFNLKAENGTIYFYLFAANAIKASILYRNFVFISK